MAHGFRKVEGNILTLILALIIFSFSALAYLPTQQIPLAIQLDYNNGTGAITGCDLNFSIYYALNGTLINKRYYGMEIGEGLYENRTWHTNLTGDYFAVANCSLGSGVFYLSGIGFTVGGEDDMIISILIALPIIFAIALIIYAVNLDKEHGILKTFLGLLSFALFWLSAQFAMTSIIKFYNFPELQNTLASAVRITGYVFIIIVVYWFIYLIYKMVKDYRMKKQERMNY